MTTRNPDQAKPEQQPDEDTSVEHVIPKALDTSKSSIADLPGAPELVQETPSSASVDSSEEAENPDDTEETDTQIPLKVPEAEPSDTISAEGNNDNPTTEAATEPGVAAEQGSGTQAQNYLPEHQSAKRSKKKIALLGFLILILLANAGMAGASIYLQKNTKPLPASQASAAAKTTLVPSNNSTVSSTDTASTLHYASDALHIEFDYPVSWRLSASAANNSIEMTSEQFTFKDYTGAQKSGTIHLFITAKENNSQFGYISGDSIVTSDSKSLAYKNPTSVQRKVTNETFVFSDTYNYDPSDQPSGAADHLLITGGTAYSKGQKLSDKDYQSTDPQIYAYIESCPETSCKYLATAATTADQWTGDETLSKIQDVIASIKVTK